MKLWNINTIRYLFEKYDCNFSKSLGQNFLVSEWVCPKMVDEAQISKEIGVLEIGPGIGVLTAELAQKAHKVVAVEIDKKLLPVLDETLKDYNNIKIINDDFLKIDLNKLLNQEFQNVDVIICANLPYYITSQILVHILKAKLPQAKVRAVVVMVQKEMAQRIVALPGSRESNVLSLMVRYYSAPTVLFDVSRGNFSPQPKVDSAVVSLDMQAGFKNDLMVNGGESLKSEDMFFYVIKAAFAQRRKTILNSLAAGLKLEKQYLIDLLNDLNVDFQKRAESLILGDYLKISNKLFDDRCKNNKKLL